MDTIGPARGYRGMIFESYYVVAGTPEVQEANSTTAFVIQIFSGRLLLKLRASSSVSWRKRTKLWH